MELQFSKQVRHSAALRAAYNALTQETYGFSFEPWYQAGYWGDAHVPYFRTPSSTAGGLFPMSRSTGWSFCWTGRPAPVSSWAR